MNKPIKVGYALALFPSDENYDFGKKQQCLNFKFKNKGKKLKLPIPFNILSKQNEEESLRSLLINIFAVYVGAKLTNEAVPEDRYHAKFAKELSALLQKYNIS